MHTHTHVHGKDYPSASRVMRACLQFDATSFVSTRFRTHLRFLCFTQNWRPCSRENRLTNTTTFQQLHLHFGGSSVLPGWDNSWVYSGTGRCSPCAPSCYASECMSFLYQKERREMCSRVSTHMHAPGKWGPYSRCLNGLCEAPECAVCAARGCGARSDAAGGLECAPKDLIPGRNMLTERYARPLGTRCKKTETRFADCERPWEVWGYMLAQLLPVRPSKTDQ